MQRRKFSREFKLEAVKLVRERGYPTKPGATIVLGCDQAFERRFLLDRAVADQPGMRGLARLRQHDVGEPLQRRCREQHDPVEPQAINYAADERLAPVGRGGHLRFKR